MAKSYCIFPTCYNGGLRNAIRILTGCSVVSLLVLQLSILSNLRTNQKLESSSRVLSIDALSPNTNSRNLEVDKETTFIKELGYLHPQNYQQEQSKQFQEQAEERYAMQNENNSRNASDEQHSPLEFLHLTSNENNFTNNPPFSAMFSQSTRNCRVIIESKADFHHEVIESIVLRYPLPWHKFNCSINKPIIYDFSLVQNRMPDITPGMYVGPRPRHLNETEFWGWKKYFENSLQYKSFDRFDDGAKTSIAYFNNLVSYDEYDTNPYGPADAVIDITCEILNKFKAKLRQKENFFCVLHREIPDLNQRAISKSCWLTPMYPDNYCTFLPIDLPRFDEKEQLALASTNPTINSTSTPELKVCIVGNRRNHTKLAHICSKIPYKEHNVMIHVLTRDIAGIKKSYRPAGLSNRVKIISERDYVKFAKHISECDILLPGKDPITSPKFFPTGKGSQKKLTGSISQLVAYKIPAVMHVALESIYHDYFTAPVEVHTDTTDTFIEALARMVERVAMDKKKKQQGVVEVK